MTAKIKQNRHTKANKRQTDAIQAAIDYGIDISMLIDNLKRTPAERIRRHQIALNTIEKLSRLRQCLRPDERKARHS